MLMSSTQPPVLKSIDGRRPGVGRTRVTGSRTLPTPPRRPVAALAARVADRQVDGPRQLPGHAGPVLDVAYQSGSRVCSRESRAGSAGAPDRWDRRARCSVSRTPDAAPVDEVLDRLDAILELPGTVVEPEPAADDGLLIDGERPRQPWRKVVLVGVVEVVRVRAERVLLDEERLGSTSCFLDDGVVVVAQADSSVSRSRPARSPAGTRSGRTAAARTPANPRSRRPGWADCR